MTRHELQLLQQINGYPCITITLPTHRTVSQGKQDVIRVKNLVKQATERLLAEMSKREAEPILTRLEQLVKTINYRHLMDGLVLCVSRDYSRAFPVPFTVKERVVIDESFFTRDLVLALNRTLRYWVLVLSEKSTRLYQATRADLMEIQEGGFPLRHTGPGGDQPLPGGLGIQKSAYRDEHHRKFFRQVDSALKSFMANDPLPLVVVGVDRFLAFFKEVTSHANSILATLLGSHDKTPAPKLGKLVWQVAQTEFAKQRQQVLAELARAVGEQKYVSTVGEVWRLAKEGRGQLLLVEEDFHFPARVDATGRHLTPAEDGAAPGVIDDAVDEIIETILNQQGRVVFVENGQLAQHQRIALVLRY